MQYRHRILIIDDEATISDMLRLGLSPFYECVFADRLSAALGIIRANDLSLIFTDLSLPDAEGFETLEKILAAAGNVPVVVGTGSINNRNATRALRMGAVGYIPKPYDLQTLPERIERAIVRGRYVASLRHQIAERDERISALKAKPSRMSVVVQVAWIGFLSALLATIATIVVELLKKSH